MDASNDPQWDNLKMLAEEATKRILSRRSSISNISMTIKIHHASMKPTKNSAAEDNEALKSYDFDKAETSGTKKHIDLGSKEFIDSMDSASEGSSSYGLDMLPMKRLKLNDNDGENVHDVIDQEWVPGESSKTKKRKKSELTKEQLQLLDQAIAEAPTVLPQGFINRINEMGGNEITLVITKYLYKTDLSPQHMRLSMPLKQIKNAGFLREGEKQVLERGIISVVLLQPSLELTNLFLAKWDAKAKHDGSRNACYILRTNWCSSSMVL